MFLALLCPWIGVASAFAPSQEVWSGIEPARILRTHPASQARLRQQAGWRAFLAGEGYGWQARFDEATGTPWSASGPGIDLGALSDRASVERALRRFFTRNAGLIGVSAESLSLRNASYVSRTQTWYVSFDRLVDGVPIWRGGVRAYIKFGRLVLLGVNTYPALRDLARPTLSASQAIRAAELAGPAALADHRDARARLVVLPMESGQGLDYRLTWEVRTRTGTPPGRWVSHVDARTGEPLNVYN